MTHKPDPEDQKLDPLFAAERATRAHPSNDFLMRVEADALRAQERFAKPALTSVKLSFWSGWSGWGGFAGLAACLVLGFGLGSGFAGQIGAFGDYYLSGGVVASDGLFPTGLEMLFSGEGS